MLFAGFLSPATVFAAAGESAIADIIGRMPADNPSLQYELAAKLADLNPEATMTLSAMLSPQTSEQDTAARYGLNALTHYVGRAGAENERKVYAAALIDALGSVADKQNKAFLISQLQLAGGQEAVSPLAGYLADDVLCDGAARALLTIGGETAEKAFLDAYAGAVGANRVMLIKALGQMQSQAAVGQIIEDAKSTDPDTRQTALYALANIGDPSAEPILKSAAQAVNVYQRGKYVSLYLLFARRQAERGNMDLCERICNSLIQQYPEPSHLRSAAIQTLRQAQASIGRVDEAGIPEGFVSLFNGKDLTGWKGLLAEPYDNPIKRAELTPEQLADEQKKADELMRKHWKVVDGILEFDGDGFSIATIKNYEDFEMLVDWKIVHPKGDSGIYLRGTPQVQIWDPAQHNVGSGGLYNNQKNPSKPSMIADNPIGQWNTFRIKMIGEKVTVHLNGKLVVDNVTLENYWDRTQPIFPSEQIELQCHGDPIHFKNIFIREIRPLENNKPINTLSAQEKADGFVALFNGRDFTGWTGHADGYGIEDGVLFCRPNTGRNIYTEKTYSNFVLRFEFKLEPGSNNGLGIRTPLEGDAAYVGMELQILDDTAEKYSNLHDWQYHGSIYGVVAAERGHLKPVGEWNYQEVIADGTRITVNLNGVTIVDADIKEASANGTLDGKEHPGLLNESGHIGFLGHGDYAAFRTIRIREL
jgi:hypothetical protein